MAAEDERELRVFTTGADGRYSTARLTLSAEGGLQVLGVEDARGARDGDELLPVGDRRVYDWVEARLRGRDSLGFASITMWGLVMVTLQVAVLILLTFEAPGLEDGAGIVRYISDNIAVHKGFGGVMLLAFAGSFLLLSMVSLPPWLVSLSVLLIGGTALGGTGVVAFHGEYEWQHIGCAAGFIGCGLTLHVIAILTGPWRWRHTVRDAIVFAFTVVSAGLFAGFLIANKVRVEESQDALDPLDRLSPRDPRLRTRWWISGVAEYMLYINMCVLNAFVGQRVFEHTAYSIFTALPELLNQSEPKRF
jgi:hypothetical protein